MFLSRWAEPLFDELAPRSRSDKKNCSGAPSAAPSAAAEVGQANEKVNDIGEHDISTHQSQPSMTAVSTAEKNLRKRRLECQQKLEVEAESRGAFCAKQRVKYHNKHQDRWEDAVVIGVHHDDGPDQPYYTIRYQKEEMNMDNNGQVEKRWVEVEKQTTPERLERVDFDPDATWQLLR